MERGLRRHAALLLVAAAYLFASPYFERINNPNENARVWATRAIVEHHVLNVDEVQREWGWVNDKAKNDHHVYSGKAPGTTFLGVPVLYLHTKLRHFVGWKSPDKAETTFWLRLFAVKLPLLAFLWAFARYVERATGSARARDLLVVALGLGTMLYPYGIMFVGHALAAAAAFSAFMLLDLLDVAPPASRRAELGRLAAAGLLAGVTVVFEYQAALVAIALAVYATVRARGRALAFFAGALPPAVALGAYHTALFGRPWRWPYAYIENPGFAQAHSEGFRGLTLPHLAAFPSFLFSPAYGLFAFSPVLALGVAGAVVLWRGGPRRYAVLVAAIAAVMFVFLAGMQNWRAGWCVGPRYIAAVVPFLLLPVVKVWHRFDDRWWAPALVVGLTIPSVFLNVISGAVYPHYPEQFDNPVFDLTLPLLGAGYAPYGLGWLLHLPGAFAMAPIALAAIAAIALPAAGDGETDGRLGPWARQVALALAVALVYLGALASYGRKPNAAEAAATATVRQLWAPPPAVRSSGRN
jgi:hypothetical protein